MYGSTSIRPQPDCQTTDCNAASAVGCIGSAVAPASGVVGCAMGNLISRRLCALRSKCNHRRQRSLAHCRVREIREKRVRAFFSRPKSKVLLYSRRNREVVTARIVHSVSSFSSPRLGPPGSSLNAEVRACLERFPRKYPAVLPLAWLPVNVYSAL